MDNGDGTTPGAKSCDYTRSRRSLGTDFTHFDAHATAIRFATSRAVPKARNASEHVDPAQLALLVKYEWHLSYATPLYGFKHSDLKTYSKQLSAFIVSEKQRGAAVEIGAEGSFKAVLSVVNGLAETEDDPDAVYIEILAKPPFAKAGDAVKAVWSGWFTCVNGSPEYLRSLPPDFVCLPLFCSSGAQTLSTLVKSWFELRFDCSFGPLNINTTCLQWLAALWTACHASSNIRYLKLAWSMPTQPPLDISFTLHPQDAWDLWSSIQEEDDVRDSIDIEEVTRFVKGLESHFFRHFKIYLSAGTLTKVATALGSAHRDGKIKMASGDYMTAVLMLLTECALLRMPV